MTINEIIEAAITAAEQGNLKELRSHLRELNSRKRFSAEQKEAITDLSARVEELAEESDDAPVTMSEKLRRARVNYVTGVTASGNKSLHTDDELAAFLEHKSLEAVLALADEFTPLDTGTHADRYASLNPGSQRMNAGNKLRAALRRGDLQFTKRGRNIVGFKVVS
jgi:hypothetical protein